MNYQVVHNTTGRCRIRVPQVANDPEYATKLKWLVESLDFVTSVRINPAASSLIVSYDAITIPTAVQANIFTCIQQADTTEISPPANQELVPQINVWERLGLPVIGLGVALLAGPLELSIPFLLVGGLIASAALPIFSRAIAGIADDRKIKVDVLDSLWITLQALQGQYVAPALMISLIETGTTLRELTARTEERQTLELLNSTDRCVWVERDGEEQWLPVGEVHQGDRAIAAVTNTRVGDLVEEVSDRLVVPTLLLSGSIFALTGNISPALAPLQLDFGTGIGIALPTAILAAFTSLARSGVFIRDGRTLEVLARTDTVVFDLTGSRREAIATGAIETLNAQGIVTYLVTDENQLRVSEFVRELREDGRTVAYVGHGSNDTAVTCADVYVSLAGIIDIEQEKADVLLVGEDLRGLTHAIHIARQAIEIVYQNVAIVAVPNISVVIAGIFFGLHPVAAVIINNCAAIIAELNGLRPLGTDALTNRAHLEMTAAFSDPHPSLLAANG